MSLTNRLSLYFLAALGVVLTGFSVSLYVLAARHLQSQSDHRLAAAALTLAASVEVFPDHVEWEPRLRRITLGEDAGPEHVRWTVRGLDGELIDCSRNLEDPDARGRAGGKSSRVLVRRLMSGRFEADAVVGRGEPFGGTIDDGIPGGPSPGSVPLPKDRTYLGNGLILTVAVADAPVAAELRQLMTAMGVISAVIWLTAAFWGRLLCRRALSPITRMAASARSIRRAAPDGSLLDVSPSRDELEDLGRAFNDLLADLQQSSERQNRFTGDASHQLRTPLTALLASVEVALRQVRSPAEYQRVLGVVRRRGGQLRQIIESLLFLARAESDCHLPDAETIDLGGWCWSWLDSWEDHPRASDLAVRIGEGATPVRANPALLGQVLDNLLDNACKYSEPGSPVVVSVESKGNGAVLVVSDKGCGIGPDELPLVCEPFFRSAQARWTGAPGVGLGLTVARRLVTLLGGRLDVASEPGLGSQLSVTLPLEIAPLPEAGQAAGNGVGATTLGIVPGQSGGARIYIPAAVVTDDDGNAVKPVAAGKEVGEIP